MQQGVAVGDRVRDGPLLEQVERDARKPGHADPTPRRVLELGYPHRRTAQPLPAHHQVGIRHDHLHRVAEAGEVHAAQRRGRSAGDDRAFGDGQRSRGAFQHVGQGRGGDGVDAVEHAEEAGVDLFVRQTCRSGVASAEDGDREFVDDGRASLGSHTKKEERARPTDTPADPRRPETP
ncbi:hypothetical protein E1181_30955 [Saccharopolyspora terrae]|uniref:Uncharacterized protein n=1 Tax=Saccharopolyspora terrae TaxID=2530384 RepID=A0A4R4V7J0_9PSEU|nr:hypothetical protein [Saccharopolyspora terrae]TDC98352.1 hypothetical protein E1181_30955 [Saccharopolyspora terrae]